MNELLSKLESILFVSNKPLSLKLLAKYVESDEATVRQALTDLREMRKDSGVVLLDAGDEYQLATNGVNNEIVKNFLNADLRESLTEATVEVLAIIAYRQPISKAEIEAIRGVNSQYSVRALLMRGLIEKVPNPNDARGSYYQITTEFLQHMGITSVADLPEFEKLVQDIKLPDVPTTKPEETPESSEEQKTTLEG